jgi:hypothetical protein
LPGRLAGDLTKAFRDPFVLVLTLLLFGGSAYAVSVFPKEGTRPASPVVATSAEATLDFKTAWFRQPRVDLGIPADGAKVVVVKFNDFQCPPCGQTYEWYKPVLEKFERTDPGAVKMVLKDWPWNAKCNFTLGAGAGAPTIRAPARPLRRFAWHATSGPPRHSRWKNGSTAIS